MTYPTIRALFENTDWAELRRQKSALCALEDDAMPEDEREGLLNFLDAIMDYAADVEGFDVYKPTGEIEVNPLAKPNPKFYVVAPSVVNGETAGEVAPSVVNGETAGEVAPSPSNEAAPLTWGLKESAQNAFSGVCKHCGSVGIVGDECDNCEPQDGLGPMVFQKVGR